MLRLLGFPKAKPESGPGWPCCFASRLSVRSGEAGGLRRAARQAPGGCAAAGLDGSYPVHVCLPSPLGGVGCSRLRCVGALVRSPLLACPLLRSVAAC